MLFEVVQRAAECRCIQNGSRSRKSTILHEGGQSESRCQMVIGLEHAASIGGHMVVVDSVQTTIGYLWNPDNCEDIPN